MGLTKPVAQAIGTGIETVFKKFGPQLTDAGRNSLRLVRNNTDIHTLSKLNPEQTKTVVEHANKGQLVYMMKDLEDAGRGLLDQSRETKAIDAVTNANTGRPEPPKTVIDNLTVSKENWAPGVEKANLSEVSEARSFRDKFKAIEGEPGESGLSTGSTIGPLEGQERGFNFESAEQKAELVKRPVGGTTVKKIKGPSGRTRTEVLAEIARMPYLELHHIFGKAMGTKIIDNVWRLIEANKASVEDLINLNHWAKSYGTGLGDFGTEAVNRIPHSDTHTFARKFGIEMSSEDIKAMPEFDDVNELTSYFRELLETRVKPMMGELDLQQGSYDLLPDKMKLDVEMLKVAKEDASRELTQSYKEKYKKKMKDTPEPVKDTYQTHKWIQEELGVTEPDLIEKARKLDEARLAQDKQLTKAKQIVEVERNKAIQSAEGKQIAKEEQSEFLPGPTTRAGQSEQYAANRIDPETTADKQMMQALTVVDDAKRQEYIDLLRKSKGRVKIEDLAYQNSKGEWKLRKINKALRNKAKGIEPKSKKR